MSDQSWALGPWCAFDTETTGVDVETARIVTSAIVTRRPPAAPVPVQLLINPGVEIPEAATRVHGVTNEQAQQGVEAAAGVKAICDGLVQAAVAAIPLIVFNASYDLSLLACECERYGLPTLSERVERAEAELFVIDPLVLDRAAVPRRKGKGARTLGALSVAYGVPLAEEDAHTAAGDCLASARVAYKIAKHFPKIADMNLRELQAYQAEKHHEWASQFEQWLRSQGKDEVIDRSWPIRQAVAA